MNIDEDIMVPQITPQLPYDSTPFKQNDQKIQAKLVSHLELLSSIFTQAELESQNKLLSVIIYKHSNQLRKYKTLQYAKRVAKMVARLEGKVVEDCLTQFRLHIDNKCKCIWKKANELSCTERKEELIQRMICKIHIIIETLRSCNSGLSWVIADLKLKNFIAYNVFLLAHFSRVRVVMLRIYEEFINAFDLMEKLSLVDKVMLDQVTLARHELLSKHEPCHKGAKDLSSMQNNVSNVLMSFKNMLDEVRINSDDKLSSGMELKISDNKEKQSACKDGDYASKEVFGSEFVTHNIVKESFDVGVSIPRRSTKSFECVIESKSVAGSTASKRKNNKLCSTGTSSKMPKQKKGKNRSINTYCCCWKCQRNRKYFHLETLIGISSNMHNFKHITSKHCIIGNAISVRRKKRRTAMFVKDKQTECEISHDNIDGQNKVHSSFISMDFFQPKLSSTKLDDIDLIFDAL